MHMADVFMYFTGSVLRSGKLYYSSSLERVLGTWNSTVHMRTSNWDNSAIEMSLSACGEEIIDEFDIARTAPTPAYIAPRKMTQVNEGGAEVDVLHMQVVGALM